MELTSWTEGYHIFKENDTEVLGISVDQIYSLNVFEATIGTLPYPLLSDWHKSIVKKYDVYNEKDEIAIRSCFLINKQGELVYKNEAFVADKKDDYDAVYEACQQL